MTDCSSFEKLQTSDFFVQKQTCQAEMLVIQIRLNINSKKNNFIDVFSLPRTAGASTA